jgi:exosome complex component RRP4
MPITIIAPKPIPRYYTRDEGNEDSDSDSSDGGADLEGDIRMRPAKRARRDDRYEIVTPGEVITDDPQWMRYALLL